MCDRTSHPEKCPHARTSHALSGIGFRTHFHTHIARAKVRYYAHVRRNPTSVILTTLTKVRSLLTNHLLPVDIFVKQFYCYMGKSAYR